MVSDLLVVGVWLLAVVEMVTIGNLHRLCRYVGFNAFSMTGPQPSESDIVTHLAKRALKAKPAGPQTWLVRPMFWVEHGEGSSAHPFCGVGILGNDDGVWKLRVRGGIGLALFIGLVGSGLWKQLAPGSGLLGELVACALATATALIVQTIEARRVFGRLW